MNLAEINSAFPEIFTAFFFMVGACVGSFLNVCIYRIPNGESIVRPPSHCKCGAPIKWYYNIPIIGWITLRGRAACCGRHISARYPFVELLTALMFAAMWHMFAPAIALCGMIFGCLMIFCSYVDLDTMTLPDAATIGGTVVAIAASAAVPSLHSIDYENVPFFAESMVSVLCALTGIAVGSGILFWLRVLGQAVFGREAMGEGDVILIGCIGGFCGWKGALAAIFGGSVIGAAILVPAVILARLYGRKFDAEVPYGPWLAIGGMAYFMGGYRIVNPWIDGFVNVLFGI